MRPDTLRGWINRAPFRHFRLHLTTGEAFEVRHREELAVQGDRVILTLGGAGGTGAPRPIDISLLHIVYIEMIPPAPSPSAN